MRSLNKLLKSRETETTAPFTDVQEAADGEDKVDKVDELLLTQDAALCPAFFSITHAKNSCVKTSTWAHQ